MSKRSAHQFSSLWGIAFSFYEFVMLEHIISPSMSIRQISKKLKMPKRPTQQFSNIWGIAFSFYEFAMLEHAVSPSMSIRQISKKLTP